MGQSKLPVFKAGVWLMSHFSATMITSLKQNRGRQPRARFWRWERQALQTTTCSSQEAMIPLSHFGAVGVALKNPWPHQREAMVGHLYLVCSLEADGE